jgi:DNA-binding sugar fermentation-stimulating protein
MVQRAGLRGFRPAEAIDPAWAAGLRRAVAAGVEVRAVQVTGDALGLNLSGLLPIEL